MLPLQGITVVSIEQAVAGPFATRQLADLGARVIKIERPDTGDFARDYDQTVKGLSSHFVWCNRSKESLTLNLKSDESKTILERLLSKADIFVQNLAPGALERLGFAPELLHEKYPQLIICSISGYGVNGPYKDKKAYDLLIQCEAGLVGITGTEDTPSKSGIAVADIAAGMYAYSGILTALLMRNKTQKGTVIEISMLEALGEWMGYPLYYSHYGGTEPKRTGSSHSTIFPYGSFPSGDNISIFLSIQNEREWKRFCEDVLLCPELTNDSRFESNTHRDKHRQELTKLIKDSFSKLTADTIIERLEEAQIANARMNTIQEFFNHPQLKFRKRWTEVDSPVGSLKALIPPVSMKDVDFLMNPIPKLGQHTIEILKDIGFEMETINHWNELGII